MAGVEIRNYEGDGADLIELIDSTWRQNFTGKTWFPLWDQAFLQWRLLDPRAGGNDFLVCAYKDTKVVGCILAECIDVVLREQPMKATLSSFLSVDPNVRTPGLAIRLIEGLRKRHKEHGVAFSKGATNEDRSLPNRKFWDALQKRKPQDFQYFHPITMWSRAIDGKAVSAAGMTPFERMAGRPAGLIPWGWVGWRKSDNVRAYRDEDLPRCLQWVHKQAEGADLAMQWTESRMDLQLGHDFVRTLVVEDEKGRGAFLNYHCLDWCAATEIKVGMIDLFAGDVGMAHQIDLLKAAGAQMKDEGVQLAMMMQSAASPSKSLLASGFVPIRPGAEMFTYLLEPDLPLSQPITVHSLFT